MLCWVHLSFLSSLGALPVPREAWALHIADMGACLSGRRTLGLGQISTGFCHVEVLTDCPCYINSTNLPMLAPFSATSCQCFCKQLAVLTGRPLLQRN
jgi:hypothetical protein